MDKSILLLNTQGNKGEHHNGELGRLEWYLLKLSPEKLGISDVADIQEVIEQLQSLERHCREMIDSNEPDCIWKADCDALGVTIKILESVREYMTAKK